MPHWEMSWQLATVVAGSMFAVAVLAWLPGRRTLAVAVPFLRETGLVVALYALWQYAGTFAVMGTDGAGARGEWIWQTERTWHLPSEAAVQRLVLPHPLVVEAFNLYYATMHFTVLIIFLIWLFARHRDSYKQVRVTLVLLTGACLLIQLVPVAPPRLIGGVGLTDTAQVYGQSVYALGGGMADQLSAMPSVHVAWAMLVAVAVWRSTSSRWRWLAVAHAVATWLVVVATANHFWLDGIVAVVLLLLAWFAACPISASLSAVAARAGTLARRDLARPESTADKLGVSADVRSLGVR
ncbi:MAG: phosphatase PAP2 family protein [Micromonosporaceae bacterium]